MPSRTRSRSMEARSSTPCGPTPSASGPTPPRALPPPRASSSARGIPPRRCGSSSTSRACASARASARRGSTSIASALAGRLEAAGTASWGGEAEAAAALRALDPAREPIVAFVGKLIVSKGVDLLLAAWPLVVREIPDARLVVVGFGAYRDGLLTLLSALRTGDLSSAREIARRGRELEGGPPGELRHLAAFLDGMDDRRRADYVEVARPAAAGVSFTGRLEHSDLADLLPACSAQVVPSTFPEAFGMVAVEGAACGALPISAAHSGLAEVTAVLAEAVDELGAKLVRWLRLEPAERERTAAALAAVAHARFGWEGVARGVISAARGELDELVAPGEPAGAVRPASG